MDDKLKSIAHLRITACRSFIGISCEGFSYDNARRMYESGDGVGIQSNFPELDQGLLKMCNKIADAIYEYLD